MSEIPPDQAYAAMGFTRWDGQTEAVPAEVWRPLQDSPRLEDIRRRNLIRRDQAGCPIVHEGFVIGWIPPSNLRPEELEKLLCALTAGLARGLETVSDLRKARRSDSSPGLPP